MRIDELFEKYPENIIGFRVNKNNKIVDFWLNNTWEVLKPKNGGIIIKKQKESESGNLTYYIVYSENQDFGVLYDTVTEIIEHNLDIERKQQLFKDKLSELKTLFTTLSYEELKAIQFETPYSLRSQETFVDDNDEVSPESVVEPTEETPVEETAEANNE